MPQNVAHTPGKENWRKETDDQKNCFRTYSHRHGVKHSAALQRQHHALVFLQLSNYVKDWARLSFICSSNLGLCLCTSNCYHTQCSYLFRQFKLLGHPTNVYDLYLCVQSTYLQTMTQIALWNCCHHTRLHFAFKCYLKEVWFCLQERLKKTPGAGGSVAVN